MIAAASAGCDVIVSDDDLGMARRERAHRGTGGQTVQVRTEGHEITAQRTGATTVGCDADCPYAAAMKAGSSGHDHGRDPMCCWEIPDEPAGS